MFNAVFRGDAVTVERLLKNGADPNQRHQLGWTLLQLAAIREHVDVLKVLLRNGADPDLGDDFSNVYLAAREKAMNSLDGVCCMNGLDKLQYSVQY